MYKKGLEASWRQWGVFDQAKFDAFVASEAVSLATEPMAKIHTQRYLAFYPSGDQGWSEWRRTGLPVLSAPTDAVNSSKKIPRRYMYGPNEPTLNGASYSAAIARTPDTQDAKVWWDK